MLRKFKSKLTNSNELRLTTINSGPKIIQRFFCQVYFAQYMDSYSIVYHAVEVEVIDKFII